jgi:hypothetical protein
MSMLLIGSLAAMKNGVRLRKVVSDHDYIVHTEDVSTLLECYGSEDVHYAEDGIHIYSTPDRHSKINAILEIEIALPGSTGYDLLQKYGGGLNVATNDDLLMLKLSHRYKKNSSHFLKTMRDIHILRSVGATVADTAWLKRREKETLNYKHPKLEGVDSVKFFKDSGIDYKYMHDDIHEAVKHLDHPAYTYYMTSDEDVHCSKDRFFDLDEHTKLLGVLEEAYVLSLERSIIPFGLESFEQRQESFIYALEKVCTSITSGWFREYAWENYAKVRKLYSQEYVDRFYHSLAEGKVRNYD